MDDLTELAIKYGTDKWGKHHYTPVYYEMFKDRRNEVKKVLEIGPAEGAGLFMLRDFFPNATIYGAEIDDKRVLKLQGLDRIKVFHVDQSSQDDLISLINNIGDDLDLVIDDGSHKPEDQVFTFLELFPNLFSKTTYVIEDVADESIIKSIPNHYLFKMVKVGKRYDDRLIIVRKSFAV